MFKFSVVLLLIPTVAFAAAGSTQYRFQRDVISSGGGEEATSSNYVLSDTIGEANIGPSESTNYQLDAGYRSGEEPYIALGCTDLVQLSELGGGEGQSTGSGTCTVDTDNVGGYSLSWHSGGPEFGLVANWKFDETGGTSAHDVSGMGNHGIHQGSPVISSEVPSNHFSTRSLDLDGSSYVSAPHTSSLDVSTNNQYTISYWINFNSTVTSRKYVIDKQETGFKGYFALIDPNSAITFAVPDGLSWNEVSTPDQSFTTGTWYHILGKYDGNTMQIYLNGEQKQTTTLNVALSSSATDLNIGRHNGGSFNIDAIVDEVRLYNTALSTGAILALVNTGPPGSMVSAELNTIPPFEHPTTSNLLAHWKFDEIAGTTSADSSGNANDGTQNNTPVISTDIPAASNTVSYRSLEFNGTDTYVQFAGASAGPLNDIGTGDFTIAMWASNNATSGYREMIANWSTTGLLFGRDTTAGKLHAYVGSGDSHVSDIDYTIPSDGSWHHYALVRTSGTVQVYVDGEAEGSSFSAAGSLASATNSRIGSRGNAVSEVWDGNIDDVRIYNKALTTAEIKALAAIPDTWSIAATSAFWGARLSSRSTDTDAKWGTDGSSDKWLAIGNGSYPLVSRSSRTPTLGSMEIIDFRAEIGTNKIQAPGEYLGVITLTASAL